MTGGERRGLPRTGIAVERGTGDEPNGNSMSIKGGKAVGEEEGTT